MLLQGHALPPIWPIREDHKYGSEGWRARGGISSSTGYQVLRRKAGEVNFESNYTGGAELWKGMRAGHNLGKTTMYEISGRRGRSEQGYEHRKRTRKDTGVLILRPPVMWEPPQISTVHSLLPHQLPPTCPPLCYSPPSIPPINFCCSKIIFP